MSETSPDKAIHIVQILLFRMKFYPMKNIVGNEWELKSPITTVAKFKHLQGK